MSYATVGDLEAYARLLGLSAPAGGVDLLEAASRDVDRICRRRNIPVDLLQADARAALSRATAAAALFRAEMGGEAVLGVDDGLASIGPVSFSARPPQRWSTLVVEELAGFGLLARSGTVAPDRA